MTVKIAFPTDDGETISPHFGKARYFQVVSLLGENEISTEMRDKGAPTSHLDPQAIQVHEPEHSHQHGAHPRKFDLLQDCTVLIGRGMGKPAYDRLRQMGVTVYLTGLKTMTEAIAQFRSGELENDMRRIHASHHHHETNE